MLFVAMTKQKLQMQGVAYAFGMRRTAITRAVWHDGVNVSSKGNCFDNPPMDLNIFSVYY